MKLHLNWEFFATPMGNLALLGCVVGIAGAAIGWQRNRQQPAPLPAPAPALPAPGPKTFTREGARLKVPDPAPRFVDTTHPHSPNRLTTAPGVQPEVAPEPPSVLPLSLVTINTAERHEPDLFAPYGRLIPCETIVTIESNRLDTPVIGLVTHDVWHDGRLIVPAGAEVHGRASLDRARERLAVSGQWTIVWRTADARNGSEVTVQGLALDREVDPSTGRWGDHDGSAGLRGQVIRTDDDRELKLFAATFLSSATAALQSTRSSSGLLGDILVPAATVRNATLAGTSAILREYADRIRESIARDGFYLRVPSGKPFYLYVTQRLDAPNQHRVGYQPQSRTPHEK